MAAEQPSNEKLYSFKQAAALIGCNFRMMYKYEKKGWLNFTKIKNKNGDLQPMVNIDEINRLIKLRARPKNSINIDELSTYFHQSNSTIRKFLHDLKIQPINWVRSNQPSSRIAYYPITAKQMIQDMLFKRHQKAAYLKITKPNTDVIYNPKTDFSIKDVIDILSPIHKLNTRTIAQWVRYQRIDYSIDVTGKLYFNQHQMNKLKKQYRNIPKNATHIQPDIIKALDTNNQTFYNFQKKYPTKPIKVLGFKYQFYTQSEVDKIKTNWPKYMQMRLQNQKNH